MSYDIDNIICINLKSFNNDQLLKLANLYDLDGVNMINAKENGYRKIWIAKGGDEPFAFTHINYGDAEDKYIDLYCDVRKLNKKEYKFYKNILNIEVINRMPKIKKTPILKEEIEEEIILDMDSILDRISKKGLDKITNEEKSFLDSLSN